MASVLLNIISFFFLLGFDFLCFFGNQKSSFTVLVHTSAEKLFAARACPPPNERMEVVVTPLDVGIKNVLFVTQNL